jgi:tetratricopeptide (TPR) repeat protein
MTPNTNAVELMDRGWALRREGKMVEAEQNITEAVALLRENGPHTDLVTALGRLGHIAVDARRWNEASALYEEGIDLCRKAGDTLGLAHKMRHLGDVHRHSKRDDEARACYAESLALYENHDNPPTLDYANAMRMVAISSEDQGQVDRAVELWSDTQKLYASVGIQEGVDECADHIAGLRATN